MFFRNNILLLPITSLAAEITVREFIEIFQLREFDQIKAVPATTSMIRTRGRSQMKVLRPRSLSREQSNAASSHPRLAAESDEELGEDDSQYYTALNTSCTHIVARLCIELTRVYLAETISMSLVSRNSCSPVQQRMRPRLQ
ncbi:unnamed protein product [Trichogramma brassicae]|uniref:Uncharacterized protein n=1 Tax=Trichogramma brassicae TaxID=86971 RepID=A0A6H5I9F7_9HYME|nr:unnamed protein product [Trichogramma brassicae]